MKKLSEISVISCNNQISTKNRNADGDMYFAHPQHLNSDGTLDKEHCLRIDSNNELIKSTVEKDDIVLVIIGGRTGQIFKYQESTPFATGQTCAIIKSDDVKLYDRLLQEKDKINEQITGTTVKMISLRRLKDLRI